jgi:very-short-patch-repair endonuclease
MAWPRRRLIAEADGVEPHDAPPALFRDRERQNDLVNAGWTVVRFTWADTLSVDRVPNVVRRALSSRR